MLIRPTAKLAKLLGARLQSVPSDPDEGCWFASLFWFERRKYVLLTHSVTRYSVLLADVRKAEISPLSDAFLPALRQALVRDGLGFAFQLLVPQPRDLEFAKTNNRSVLGTMNEFSFQIEFSLHRHVDQGQVDAKALTHEINNWISLKLEHSRPRSELRAWLEARSG